MIHNIIAPDNITLRPATLTDARTLARLWVSVFPEKFDPILGKNGSMILCEWFRLSQSRIQMTTVAEVENQPVGFITLETPTSPRPDDGRLLWYALQRYNGLVGAWRSLALMWLMDQEHDCRDDEVYIEMLGVARPWQGCGIASHLMEHAEAVALAQSARYVCLSVMIDNQPAVHLYEKRGFRITSEKRSRLLKWIIGYSGYYEMEKVVW